MANRKLFVFDIDGTLLDENKQIPDSTREAVKRLAENYEGLGKNQLLTNKKNNENRRF